MKAQIFFSPELLTNLENQSPTTSLHFCPKPQSRTAPGLSACAALILFFSFSHAQLSQIPLSLGFRYFIYFFLFPTTCSTSCVCINPGVPRSRKTNFSESVSFPLKMFECHETQMPKIFWVQL